MAAVLKVERVKVGRLTSVPFEDGRATVVEGLDFIAECGCKIVYGMRLDKHERTMVVIPCDTHDADEIERKMLEAGRRGHPLYDADTVDVIAAVLS